MVIWLPRSRPHSRGEYQERVWCSFEAAMVQIRGDVPVVVAGYRPSAEQRVMVAAGSLSALPLCCSLNRIRPTRSCGQQRQPDAQLATLTTTNMCASLPAALLWQ